MKEYSFAYTNQRNAILLIVGCLLSVAVCMLLGIGIFHNSNLDLPIAIISIIAPFIVFRVFKNKVLKNGAAKLNKTCVEFELENGMDKLIDFRDLVSYKIYYSAKGPILTLKMSNDKFRIFTHNLYCNTDSFEAFCKDLQIEIENYKATNKIDIITEGSVFAKSGAVYFLSVMTLIYIVALFTINDSIVRTITAIFGVLYFLILWIKWFVERNKKLGKK